MCTYFEILGFHENLVSQLTWFNSHIDFQRRDRKSEPFNKIYKFYRFSMRSLIFLETIQHLYEQFRINLSRSKIVVRHFVSRFSYFL